MRIFKKILIFILVLIVLIFIGLFLYWNHLKPTYNGELKLSGLSDKVEVYYDDMGVPHIYANSQTDAYLSLGYVHAQDRLWQMELVRRIAAGRLSEILGKKLLPTDKFFRGLGITHHVKKTIANLDKTSESYLLTQAYLKGVNQFIDNGATPLEYKLVGVEKENFVLEDIYNVFGYMSFSFAIAHKTDPLLSKMKAQLDPKYLAELGLNIDPSTTTIPVFNPSQGIESQFVLAVNDIMDNLPVSPFIGSNAWVVGAEKTEKGKVIFTNDPHIEYSQPATWYQAHIVCPNFEIYGFNLALTPFPLLGHNRDYAYGLTMFENDDIDFYYEKNHPKNSNQYQTDTGYLSYFTRYEVIKVKDLPDEKITIKVSKHGPIMNDFIDNIDDERPIAMDWIYTKFENKMLEASYGMSHATELDNFKSAVAKIHAPGLNVMYGDSDDNIAWFAAGKLYRHNNGVETKFILNGYNAVDDQLNFMEFKDNPQSINPPWNFVYSANNQPDSIKNGLYPGYYLPENRAKRIKDVLLDLDDISANDMKYLVNDNTSSILPNLLKGMLKNINKNELSSFEKDAFTVLKSWDGSYELNQIAPTIFTKFKYEILKNIFEDELGKVGFQQFMATHLVKRQFNKQMKNDFSVWNDDITTTTVVETKKDILTKSFKETVRFLNKQHGELITSWTWDKVHTVEYEHLLGKASEALRPYFNVGPFPISGSNEVLNNQIFTLNGDGVYKVKAGPSSRRVIDFSDVENSVAIIPTGQSGNVFSKFYKNQAEKFVNGEFVPMLLNKGVIQMSDDKLVFLKDD